MTADQKPVWEYPREEQRAILARSRARRREEIRQEAKVEVKLAKAAKKQRREVVLLGQKVERVCDRAVDSARRQQAKRAWFVKREAERQQDKIDAQWVKQTAVFVEGGGALSPQEWKKLDRLDPLKARKLRSAPPLSVRDAWTKARVLASTKRFG